MLDVLQNQLDFSISRFQNMPCCVLWRPSNLFTMLGRKGTTSGSNQYICFCIGGPILTSHSIEPAQLPWDSPALDPSSPRSLHWQLSRTRHQLHRAWLVLLQRRCKDLPRQCVLMRLDSSLVPLGRDLFLPEFGAIWQGRALYCR